MFLGCPEDQIVWVGDGICDDETNNVLCSYDAGDCCLDMIIDTECVTCLCFTTNLRHPSEDASATITSATDPSTETLATEIDVTIVTEIGATTTWNEGGKVSLT